MVARKVGVSLRRDGSSVATLEVSQPAQPRRRGTPVERQYVGIDLHGRRSVIVRRDAAGVTHSTVRLDNRDIGGILRDVRAAGPEPDVIVEASGTRELPALSRSTSSATRAGTPSGSSASP